MAQLATPFTSITYDGKDITAEISQYLLSFTYTDNVKGKSDELELELEDTRDLWKGAWHPEKGSKITAKFGYVGQLVSAGTFTINETQASGPPDIFRIRAMAASTSQAVRTKNSFAHEDKTLRQIASVIAVKHGFTIQGITDDMRIGRVTQNEETDLSFLRRIAGLYGYVFSLRDKTLTFSNVFDLEASQPVTTVDKKDMITYDFTDKLVETYRRARAKSHKPMSKVAVSAFADLGVDPSASPSADTLEVRSRAENELQCESKAKAALHKKNTVGTTGTFSIPGDPYLVAGNNFTVTGYGVLDGVYHIEASRHIITRDGAYTTEVQCKRVKKK